MAGLPDALFVIDTRLETIAIKEAVKLGIPVIGVADTNCDPDEIDFIIPGNDDALRAIRLVADTIAQAYLDGKAVFEAQQKEIAEQMEKQRQLQAQQAAAAREAAAKAAASAAEARKNAEGKEPSEQATPSEGTPADAAAKPKTTVRKTLQRKAKPRKAEPAAPADSTTAPGTADEPANLSGTEGEPADDQKLS